MQGFLQFASSYYEETIVLVCCVVTLLLFFNFYLRKEYRIFKNLKKNIYLIETGTDGLQREYALLKENKLLYRVHDAILNLSTNPNVLDTTKEGSIWVVNYSENYADYSGLVDLARIKKTALVVFAKHPLKITNVQHLKAFDTYVYIDLCNSVSRLLIVIFNLAIIMPHKKN
jgi:hypothetical protein